MAHSNSKKAAAPKAPPAPFVEATFLFRDVLRKPIEGLSIQLKVGQGTPPAPKWITGPDSTLDVQPAAPTPNSASPGAAPAQPGSSASTAAAASAPAVAPVKSDSNPGTVAASPSATGQPAASPDASLVANNMFEATTDKDGFSVTITNIARNQPVDVFVKNKRGEYVLKATVKPSKDISAFTIVSPEYHVDATTQLTAKDELEQNLDLPVVKDGEVMTIERLVKDFGQYIGWIQKVTEQGQVKKDFPARNKEIVENPKTHKKTTKITISHHYKVVDTGNPKTVSFGVLGSRLNYPSPALFSEDQYKHIATELGVEVAAVKAIVQQESGGHPFMENGLPQILYERHYFFNISVEKLRQKEKEEKGKEKPDASKKGKSATHKKKKIENPYPNFPDICFPQRGGYGPDGLHQYERMIRAASLDLDVALRSCSWGGFQIMGDYYASCGCSSAIDFANKFISGTDAQAEIFILFMKNVKSAAVDGLKTHDWRAVASSYNGGGWESSNPDYATNLDKYYREFK
ncbi:N-acetylmuramidase family protein [Burkholderia sp. 3C]